LKVRLVVLLNWVALQTTGGALVTGGYNNTKKESTQ